MLSSKMTVADVEIVPGPRLGDWLFISLRQLEMFGNRLGCGGGA